MEPVLTYTPPQHKICSLESAFTSLSNEEYAQEWGKELILGDAFARELDYYRAITCYKRALILLPEDQIERRLQIDYNIILSYYLGLKYQEAINVFEESQLTMVNPIFPAFSNLMIILYDCYRQTGQMDKMECLLNMIQKCSPETAEDLILYCNLKTGNLIEAEIQISKHPCKEELQPYIDQYHQFAKSPSKARQLNALLPGLGYYYVGQKKSAVTSFIINALFTAAAYQFFHRGYVAAGAITTSLELGWYLGGINGAGIAAEEYNTRLYEGTIKPLLIDHCFFPVLMFETAF